jgi:hypothetical protein
MKHFKSAQRALFALQVAAAVVLAYLMIKALKLLFALM